MEDYYEYIEEILRSGELTIDEQKLILPFYAEYFESYAFPDFPESEKGIRWEDFDDRIYLLTPDGWMLPEDMDQSNWLRAGMTDEQYLESIS